MFSVVLKGLFKFGNMLLKQKITITQKSRHFQRELRNFIYLLAETTGIMKRVSIFDCASKHFFFKKKRLKNVHLYSSKPISTVFQMKKL